MLPPQETPVMIVKQHRGSSASHLSLLLPILVYCFLCTLLNEAIWHKLITLLSRKEQKRLRLSMSI